VLASHSTTSAGWNQRESVGMSDSLLRALEVKRRNSLGRPLAR